MTGTLTITNYPFRDRWNDCQVRRARYAGPSSYVTGGDTISNVVDFGWGETHTLLGTITDGTTLYVLHLDYANQRILVFVASTGIEVANGVDLSTFNGQIVATGK